MNNSVGHKKLKLDDEYNLFIEDSTNRVWPCPPHLWCVLFSDPGKNKLL